MKKKRYLSIKAYILISVLFLLLMSHVLLYVLSFAMVKRKIEEGKTTELVNSVNNINVQLQLVGLTDPLNEDIHLKVQERAGYQMGRIIIVSREYKILEETAGVALNEYMVSKDVMDVMTGKTDRKTFLNGSQAEVMMPIERSGEIVGVIISNSDLTNMYEQLRFEFVSIGVVSVLLLLIEMLIVHAIAKNAVKDLGRINEQISHTNQGNLRDKLPPQSFAETEELAEGYNQVVQQLASIDETRSEFVSNVSHELKTPITSMKVLAESITQNEGASVDDYREFMTDIVEEIDRETKIINDLLTLVKTDSQNAQMNFEEKNINEMMETIVKTVRPLAVQRGIDLSYESFKDVTAEIDEVKLSLAISNLIENAVKYNIDNGWIKCSLNGDSKNFYIKVADSGVGIPDNEKDKVFDRFYRVDKARSRDTGGTGLGLSITRGIINGHKGTIKLYSESGKGTTFTVRIPLAQDKADAATGVLVAEEPMGTLQNGPETTA